jgi:hypothetical protein
MAYPTIGGKYNKYISKLSIDTSYTKKCVYPNCETVPIYNYIIHKNGMYCKLHKLDGMEDVKNNKCIYDKCNTRSNYNYKGKTKGIYCSRHKLDGMINIVYKLCPIKGCGRIPQFNYPNEKIGLYCSKHQEPGMRNVKKKTLKELMTELEQKIIATRNKMENRVKILYESAQLKIQRLNQNNDENINKNINENNNQYDILTDNEDEIIEEDDEEEDDESRKNKNDKLIEKLIGYANMDQIETIIMSRWKIEKYLYLLAQASSNKYIEKAVAKKIIEML